MEKSCMPRACKGAQRISCKMHKGWKLHRAAGLETKLNGGERGKKGRYDLNKFPSAVSLEQMMFCAVLGVIVAGLALGLKLLCPGHAERAGVRSPRFFH